MAPTDALSISERDGRILLRGEIDLATAPQLVAHLEVACRPGADLVVDMRDVTFIDSSGLGALIRIAKHCRAAGGEVRIHHWPAMFQKMLEITGVGFFFRLDEPPPA